MDPRFCITREDLYNLQMEVKQVQYAQTSHAERLLRLEKRQVDDAALKSVWNSPFPGVLAGTPQQGPVPQADMFDDLDDSGEQLLGSLHLGPTEEEPTRRGAASRANSVRFDESALHGSSWSGHNARHSGDFGPTRPGSGLMMERSSSHKSDGRHSSAGHSVHSHHSVVSTGRASSLGLDTNFAVIDDDDDSLDIPEPPVSFYILGTVPSIIRCWLTTNYAHDTLLYADICTGSQKCIIDYALVKELDLTDEIQRDADGVQRIRLDVFFAEAVVTRHGSRSTSPERAVPSMTAVFEITSIDSSTSPAGKKGIRIFIGSDALRAHSADILFSRNLMVLYGNDRSRLRVPFVRPEDDQAFRHICTAAMVPDKPKLNANAQPFVFGDNNSIHHDTPPTPGPEHDVNVNGDTIDSPVTTRSDNAGMPEGTGASDFKSDGEQFPKHIHEQHSDARDISAASDSARKDSTPGIWGSWRQGSGNGSDGSSRENGPLSGYQPAARPSRTMKVLKPQKLTSARTGAAYEPAPITRSGGEGRRKSIASASGDPGSSTSSRWEAKRIVSSGTEATSSSQSSVGREVRNGPAPTRSTNPVGGASAFSWMTPPGRPKNST